MVGLALGVLGECFGELTHEIAFDVGERGVVIGVQEHGVGVRNTARVFGHLGIGNTQQLAPHFDGANAGVVGAQRHNFSVRLTTLQLAALDVCSSVAEVTSEAERARIQHRILRVLVGGQIIGAAALGASVTVGAFVIQDILGAQTPLGGLASATVTMGTAFMSQMLSRLMLKHGRRVGLQSGYLLAATGGVVAAVGVEKLSLVWFIGGLFLFGSGQASNLLARYAATDLALPNERSRAMSRVVFASTFGAVFGPLLVSPAQWAGERWFSLATYTGPWLAASIFLLLAAINTAVRLRPDPLLVAGATATVPQTRGVWGALRVTIRSSKGRLALMAMVISQATMVAVMTMTPVHLKLHGHETVSPYVVSLHIAGMFAFSPLVGRYADRYGRVNAIFVGAVLLVAAGALSAVSGDGHIVLFPSLWLLGIGWNFGLIGGSSLLVESAVDSDRVRVQGVADLLMSFCGGVAGFASGFVRRAIGFHLLSFSALVLAAVLVVYLVVGAPRLRPTVASLIGRR
jgi:MFS family permease